MVEMTTKKLVDTERDFVDLMVFNVIFLSKNKALCHKIATLT